MSDADHGQVSVARKRILDCASDLFAHRGIHAVGVDELIEKADVARATFYRHFPSKEHLVVAFIAQREQLWLHGWLESEAKARGNTPEEQLLAVFDLLGEWFSQDDFEGDPIINTLLETGTRQPLISAACKAALQSLRWFISGLAEQAGLRDSHEFALSWHVLMNGAILSAEEGDLDAAKRAQTLARALIGHHRQTPSHSPAR
jgi:AcrR family transcriptional regulator